MTDKVSPPTSPHVTEPANRFRALVVLRRGGARLPFFCVHGAGGNVLNFNDLSRALHSAQSFIGLQARGVDGVSRPHRSIEEMASAYAAEVRAFQPCGPYLLGGYSGGGIVAFEMARLLSAAGERVALLALLDTLHPDTPTRPVTLATRLTRMREEGWAYVLEGLQRQRDHHREMHDRRLLERHIATGQAIPFALRELHLVTNFRNAVHRYQPKPWAGRVTLFRAAEVGHLYRDGDHTLGWDRYALAGVEIIPVPGGHETLLLPENVKHWGRALNAVIERAQSYP